MTIYIYIKTHRVTGLKYFGKTIEEDPYNYKGSGLYWKSHIKKHGYNVETEIVGSFENLNEASEFAIKFSKENNIVESDEWANLMEENCHYGLPFGFVHSEETRKKLSKTNKGRKIEWSEKISNALKGRKLSEEHRRHVSEGHKGKYTRENNPNFGRKHSKEARENMRQAHLGKPNPKSGMGNAETWIVISPNGEEQEIFNLCKFCRENNLSKGHMIGIAIGRKSCKTHKGWKCKKLKE